MATKTRRNVKITAASITKEIFLKGNYVEVMGKNGEQKHAISSSVKVHDDLRNAFQQLRIHCIHLAEVYGKEGIVGIEKIDVIGFSISGDDDEEGVTISFSRELTSLQTVSINTPFIKWNDSLVPYPEADDLSMLIEDCKAEVYSYVFEDKCAPDKQLDLFAQKKDDI